MSKIARYVSLASLFLIPIFPLIVIDQLFFPFITGKAFYFRLLVEAAFAGWLVLCFLDAKYRPKWNALTIGVSVFALVTLAADLLGVNPLRSLWSNFERMEGWITVIHLWAFFMVALNVFGPGEEGKILWRRWLNFELLVAILVGFYGLFQLFGWAAIHQGSVRIDASLGNAAYMAVYMLLNAGIAAYLFFSARARKAARAGFLNWYYPILAVFFSFLLIETATRGTILGLVGGIMLALLVYAVFGKGQSIGSRRISGGAVSLLVILGVAFVLLRHQPFIQKNPILGRMASISLSSDETTARLYVWSMALTGFVERPVLGWGQENFNYIFNANYNPKLWNQEQWFDRAHSVYLDWLTASGTIGLLSYLSLYFLFLYAVWKSSLSAAEKSVLSGLLAGYAIHNAFVFDNLASYVLFFALLAFAASLKEGRPVPWLGSKPLSSEAVEYVAAPAVMLALIAVVWLFNVRPLEANTRLISALTACTGPSPDPALFESALSIDAYVANQEIREQLLSCGSAIIANRQASGQTMQGFYDLSTKAIKDQIAAAPWKDARTYTLAGSFMDTIGQYSAAAQLLTTAHELSPLKQSIAIELSNSLINIGKLDEAASLLGDTYNTDIGDGQAKLAYAVALVADGKEPEARKLMGNDPAAWNTPQMAQGYIVAKDYAGAIKVYQALLLASPGDVGTTVSLAQAEYAAGMKAEAIQTVRGIETSHPEYKDQIEAAIKQLAQ